MITLEKELIEDRVKEITARLLAHEMEELRNSDSFEDDLGADSLDSLEIILELERIYGLDLPDDDYDKFRTIGDLVDYIDAVVNPVGI